MTRAVLAVLLAACSSNAGGDYPTRPGGGGPVGGGGGGSADAGAGDGGAGDAGVLVAGRVCIIKDLRHLTDCDTAKDASVVSVTLGTRSPTTAPARTGEFTIVAPLGTDLVWRAKATNFVTSVMPFGTDNVLPIVPDALYTELLSQNSVTLLPEGQGSVVVRVVTGTAPAAGVTGTTTLVSNNVIPRYDEANSAIDWGLVGPTQTAGELWFPGVDVTTTPARITLTPSTGTPVTVSVSVEDQAITFLTQDVQ